MKRNFAARQTKRESNKREGDYDLSHVLDRSRR
jgi:hypothetical protein